MYHGWSDTSIAPLVSVAYYISVQRDIGAINVDRFLKLFMIPGMGHCGGGDGFSQVDTLTPLMAWVEEGKAPTMLVGEKVQAGRGMAGLSRFQRRVALSQSGTALWWLKLLPTPPRLQAPLQATGKDTFCS